MQPTFIANSALRAYKAEAKANVVNNNIKKSITEKVIFENCLVVNKTAKLITNKTEHIDNFNDLKKEM